MLDKFNREINYLRISITDRCNLRCTYCMPAEGIKLIKHSDILSFEEIFNFAKTAVKLGVRKIRLTGGEPLVRKGIVDLVRLIASIEGVKDFGMTTNGVLLEKYARQLKDAGLHRINISLDTTNPDRYKQLTRGGDIQKVFAGIEAAKKAKLFPIKINTVIEKSVNEPDAKLVAEFAKQNNLQIRFIEQMDLEKGRFGIVHGGSGGDCAHCNRLRLTSDGLIKPCLFGNKFVRIRDFNSYEEAILEAVKIKPKCGISNSGNKFFNIGG